MSDENGVSRRTFLSLLGAGASIATGACTRPTSEVLLPYTVSPEHQIPGERLHFATMTTLGGFAVPVLAASLDGRPIKLDGMSGSDVFTQAAILDLYDPTRAQSVTHRGRPSTWEAFEKSFVPDAILLEPTTSAMTLALLEQVRTKHPNVQVFFAAPLKSKAPAMVRYRLDRAKVVVTLDADLLGPGPAMQENARGFGASSLRLYALEPTLTLTGMNADHRWPLTRAGIAQVATELLRALDGQKPSERWVQAIADDLQRHPSASVVAVGERLPPAIHATAFALNERLGNVGQTVSYLQSPLQQGPGIRSLMRTPVKRLLIAGGNPAYWRPAFGEWMKGLDEVAYLGPYANETAAAAAWLLPESHFLETWNDALAIDGTRTFAQPLISPLYDTKSLHDVLAALAGEAPRQSSAQRMRAFWTTRLPATLSWERALQQGTLPGEPWQEITPPASSTVETRIGLQLDVRHDAKAWDGRFAHNVWLQELPDPVTKQTWGNAALVSPALAEQFQLETGRVVRLKRGDVTLDVPVYVLPGQADEVVTLHAGYGRRASLLVDGPVGVNAFLLGAGPVTLEKLGHTVQLAITQEHWSVDLPEARERKPLYEFAAAPTQEGPQWGMAIDLDACTGCSVCVIACQSENNIAVVGPEEVIRSREMHWIRIDRSFVGDHTEVRPMLCQHCEKAPCEYVCPVNATTHSPDGLNEMTYNRCVGTRFCSNNCPYKVRRFNWFDYQAHEAPTLALTRNDQVTVRARGVMEKCTFCVQRIRVAGHRKQPPSSVKTACQEACPTQAIVFGDLSDPQSEVSKRFADPRAYQALEELGTRPRVRYLERRRRPNPELAS